MTNAPLSCAGGDVAHCRFDLDIERKSAVCQAPVNSDRPAPEPDIWLRDVYIGNPPYYKQQKELDNR